MSKLNDVEYIEQNWLDWCRLCANDDATIDVRHKDAYMRIISKCFDIEIGLEEPELGAMLCKDCYCFVGVLLNFVENVNKVQPIFELLRHTESNEQVDVPALRHEYGLQNFSSKDSYKIEALGFREQSEDLENQIFLQDDSSDSDNPDEAALSAISMPAKIRRGRPKGTKNRLLKESVESNESSFAFQADSCHSVKEESVWLKETLWEDDESSQHRKRGHPKLPVKTESEESQDEMEISMRSTVEPAEYLDEILPDPIKRKRGRPRKDRLYCKNVALSRLLLASPEPELGTIKRNNDSGNRRHSVTCGICYKQLMSPIGLKYHIDRVHMNKKPFICDCCGKCVKTASELKEHKLVHTDDRPFVCALCNAAFKNKKRLNIHSQTHGEPSYECEICGKKLQTRAIWNKHKVVHTNERRFECTICGTAIKNSTALKIHLLSHTGLRPYTCKYCDKDFACGANCREHKKRKHPVEYAKDDDKSSRKSNVPTLDELRALAAGMEKGERLRKPRAMKLNK
ncbi:zinc finger protein weckle [Drosophila grimshawi]|uniref:GH22488 n=1 Tax=Drosophila grimshawi TaxID=7222 RepID=B4JSI7_DROGR|nr:zinc finger protein weckle [Drosophila grimshawi]EDV94727.1 GH22488 [Drosophila grimshawi]